MVGLVAPIWSQGADRSACYVAALGNFDGVHRGHQALLNATRAEAAAVRAKTAVVVFDPHPRRYFRPDDPPFLLTTPTLREELLFDYGADAVISLPFHDELAALSPETFVRDILKSSLGLRGVTTGAEFKFGAGRAGDAAMLAALCAQHGLSAKAVEPLAAVDLNDEEKIGSSLIRKALRVGDVCEAARLMGRRWRVDGVVREGRRLGRTIGFPTANLSLGPLLEPKYGVYAVLASAPCGEFKAVANFGRRPTVGAAEAALLEVHLMDFDGDLYDEPLRISFVDFVRPEHKFEGIDALKAQIARDCEAAAAILS